MKWLLVFLCLSPQGCARLSCGPLPPENTKIFLIRGYLDWYSTGIDQLTQSLKTEGLQASSFREEQWGDLGNALSKALPRPLILIGYSYGADDVILIAQRLNERHHPVDLLITIDPVTPASIPPNVKQCVNFFESNGWRDFFPWLRGIPLRPEAGANVENIDVRQRPDLTTAGMSHGTIAGDRKIHREIIELIWDLYHARKIGNVGN